MLGDPMLDASATKQLTNEDRLILAESFVVFAEQLLGARGEHDVGAAALLARRLCTTLGIDVKPIPAAFAPDPDQLLLALGYAVRTRQALTGRRVRDLPRFVEGLCQNLGLDIDSAEGGTHIRAIIEHVELNLVG